MREREIETGGPKNVLL